MQLFKEELHALQQSGLTPMMNYHGQRRDIVQNIEVAEDGEVTITVKPSRPHCPCCLLDLDKFQNQIIAD